MIFPLYLSALEISIDHLGIGRGFLALEKVRVQAFAIAYTASLTLLWGVSEPRDLLFVRFKELWSAEVFRGPQIFQITQKVVRGGLFVSWGASAGEIWWLWKILCWQIERRLWWLLDVYLGLMFLFLGFLSSFEKFIKSLEFLYWILILIGYNLLWVFRIWYPLRWIKVTVRSYPFCFQKGRIYSYIVSLRYWPNP